VKNSSGVLCRPGRKFNHGYTASLEIRLGMAFSI
jgi:hypothetical protein